MEAETATALPAEKPVMLVGIDDSEHSVYALQWAFDHFFAPHTPNFPFKLIVVHAKPAPASSFAVAGVTEILPSIESDLKKTAAIVVDKAKEFCISNSLSDSAVEVWEGDARSVMCEAVEKHHAAVLVLGSHGYGAIKRAVLGSVSDYCAHHAHCSVMIVKKPKAKH